MTILLQRCLIILRSRTSLLPLIKIGRRIYSDKDDGARKLAELIGAKIIPKRPKPIVNGLERIGIEGSFGNLNYSQIEDLFLAHMSLSEL